MNSDGFVELLARIRCATLELVGHLEPPELERKYHPLLSPPIWDLAHIAAFEDLWLCQQLGGLAPADPDRAHLYDAALTPRPLREVGKLGLLDCQQTFAFLRAVRARAETVLGSASATAGKLVELVARHELQHAETIRQALALAGLLPAREPPPMKLESEGEGFGFRVIEEGELLLGAAGEGFAYDNERPAHPVLVGPFAIARRPLSNGDWQRFVEAGGYARRELWSAAGWRWLGHQRQPFHQTDRSDPTGCLVHINLHEASALARFYAARLPTEVEWELAARRGLLEWTGLVWEWTASEFGPYPGFKADPYPEYSEPFFGRGYFVLRGWSWATAPRLRSVSFRNWDLPDRRLIFAGARLAREVER